MRLRNRPIGSCVKCIQKKYGSFVALDVGANVGDTAAVIASFADASSIIAVEPSEVYARCLELNATQISNITEVLRVFVSSGPLRGRLVHWGGTAYVSPDDCANELPTIDIQDLMSSHSNLRFLKVDIDGADRAIIHRALSAGVSTHPVIFYEDEIRSWVDIEEAEVVAKLGCELGYNRFIVWDSEGFMMLSSNEFRHLLRFHLWELLAHRLDQGHRVWGFDLALFHDSDADVWSQVTEDYEKYSIDQLSHECHGDPTARQ